MRPRQMIKGAMKSPGRRAIVAVVPVVIAAGVLWTTGVLPRWVGMQTGAPAAPITFIPGTPGTASWASSYEDFGELCNLSDLVVVGVADRIVELLPADWGHSDYFEFYDVSSAFKVESVLKGKAGTEITLTHTVMKTPEGWREAFAEDPPPRPGERWVFFLRRHDPDYYSEVGPWGRYKIVDGKVYSMNRVLRDNNSYYAPKLDFDGLDVSTFLGQVKEALDSVVMTFADNHNLPDRALRFHAGVYQTVNVDLSTGTHGPDELTYTAKRVAGRDTRDEMPIPAGLTLTIEPHRLTAYPRNQYRSTLRIETTADLAPGTYWVCVEYRLGESTSGYRVIMVNVEAAAESSMG